MARRYLNIQEAEVTLRRGKTVESFLGGFTLDGERCIRWADFQLNEAGVTANLWEAYDQGSEEYADIYTFDSPHTEYIEPVKVVHSKNLEDAAKELGLTEYKFVNRGVVQDEYLSYLAHT